MAARILVVEDEFFIAQEIADAVVTGFSPKQLTGAMAAAPALATPLDSDHLIAALGAIAPRA